MKNKTYKSKDLEIQNSINERRKTRKKYYKLEEDRLKKGPRLYSKAISFQEIKKSNLDYNDEYSSFDYNSYNFVDFKDTKWGEKLLLNENYMTKVVDKSFYYVNFMSCEFENIKFLNCNFHGCLFEKCGTAIGKAIFENCVFRGTEIEYQAAKHLIKPLICEFKDCSMLHIEFKNSFADNINFDNCTLMDSKFEESDLNGSIFISCSFYGVQFINSYMDNMKITKMKNYDLEFHGTRNVTNVYTEVYISKIGIPSIHDGNDEFTNLSKLYFTIYNVLKRISINEEYVREYSYFYNYYSMKSKKNFGDKIVPFLSWILFGFGERMGRFIIWFTLFILGFASIYMFTGINYSSGKVINYSLTGTTETFNQIVNDFFQCVHFSIITFSTVGYGNITPIGWSLLVSGIQVISGLAMIALFTSVIVKKFLK